MSDSPFFSPSRGEAPPPTPFDPGSGALPPSLAWSPAEPETVVLLVDAARDRGWAADVAVSVAGAWARAGRRVVLADLHLEEAVLHERLGEPNLDGVVDVFLYGASLARTARPVRGHGFYLISSGTYTPDPGSVLGHPRWSKVLAGFSDAQATLLLFVPAESPGIDALARLAGTAILLGDGAAAPPEVRVRAVVVPEEARGAAARFPEPLEVLPAPDPFEERADPLIGEYAGGIPASTLPPGALRPPRAPDLTEPPPPAEPRAGGKRRKGEEPRERKVSPVLLLVLLLVVLFAAGYYGWRTFPDLVQRLRGGAPAEEPASAAPAAPAPAAKGTAAAPAPAGVELPYAVHVKAYASPEPARQMIAAEAPRFSDVALYVSPDWIDGVPYYRVLAGLLPDTAEAARLRQRLIDGGVVDDSDPEQALIRIQYTPLAFHLGEYPARPAALARVDSLQAVEVPAYAVAVPYASGPERWRVYGGAFRDSTAAEVMRRLLAEKKIEAPLVARTGRGVRTGG